MEKTKFAAVVYNYIYNAATSGKAVTGIKSLELPCVPVKSFRDAEASNLAGLARVRKAFRKRLDTYLKRYGTKKLHTWSYWANA